MSSDPSSNARLWPAALAASSLALLLLAAQVASMASESLTLLQSNKITAAVLHDGRIGSILGWQLAGYAGALLLTHLLLAGLAVALAGATRRARVIDATLPQLSLLWTLALAGSAHVLNSAWYPGSRFASGSAALATPMGPLVAGEWLVVAGLGVALLPCLRHWLKSPHRVAIGTAALGAGGLALVVHAWPAGGVPLLDAAQAAAPPGSKPNVIIVGIDSLRCDMTALQGEQTSRTPAIDRFLAGAHVFSDTTTPLARTFPAWVSVLSGRHPASTGASFNLIPRSQVMAGPTLGSELRAAGYVGTYATDEVRFANIDESFGFDRLATPTIGAADFLLGTVNDFPLTNVLSSSLLGRWLFPATHANRAAAATYRPADFVERLDRALRPGGPQFVVTHLTLAHWPYSWAGRVKPTQPQQYRDAYQHALAEVDRQFAAVMDVYREHGLLDNAIVVVLSDHGEALGFQGDSLIRGFGSAPQVWNTLWGHGTSVLSPHQFQVLLAVRAYGPAQRLVAAPRAHTLPASLEDVAPTLLELVGAPARARFDGVSLAAALRASGADPVAPDRIRYTETDMNTPMLLAGKYDEQGLLAEAGIYYRLNPANGRVELRPDRLPELMSRKERAAMRGDYLLAVLPRAAQQPPEVLLIDRRRGWPMRLTERPDPTVQPDGAALWEALATRHGRGIFVQSILEEAAPGATRAPS